MIRVCISITILQLHIKDICFTFYSYIKDSVLFPQLLTMSPLLLEASFQAYQACLEQVDQMMMLRVLIMSSRCERRG